MEEFLAKLSEKVTVGLVGGSDHCKILEQMGGDYALEKYSYIFSENGVIAYKDGKLFHEMVTIFFQINCLYWFYIGTNC